MQLTNYDLHCQNHTTSLFVVVLIKENILQSAPYLFYTIFIIEIVNLFISFCFFLPIVLILNRFRLYHTNIIRLVQIFLATYYIVIIARAITISYEIRLFETKGSMPEDLIMLLGSVCRIGFTAQYACMVPILLLERAFATYYVEDYERKRRPWIVFLGYGLALVNGSIASGMLTYGEISFTHLIIFATIIISGIISFVVFYQYNSRKLADLSSQYHSTSHYTLSVRYQVTENLKVMKKIITVTIIMTCFLSVVVIFTILSFLVYGFFTFMGQVCMALLEMWIAFSANAVTACLFFLSKNWSNATLRHLLGKDNEVKMISKPKETTDIYFAQFAKQW